MQTKEIFFAGGCFWGVEGYFSRINGVQSAVSGYANGQTKNPSYEDVVYRNTGHAEAVRVTYNPDLVSLTELLLHFFRIVNPTTLNQQGNDIGSQYRSGVYFVDGADKNVIAEALGHLQHQYTKPLVVENLPLQMFYQAEEYHQAYLRKNPDGYCHIDLALAAKPL